MHEAVDCATDETVSADVASHVRRYRCARCYAPVKLRGGVQYSIHFAHVSGKADPDCEEYFGGNYFYAGRKYQSRLNDLTSRDADTSELYFDVETSGPTLSLWLPSAQGSGVWEGSIDISTATANRRMSSQHLESGRFVAFELIDGQWNVATVGDVSSDYTMRLDLGPGALESGINIFDATRSPGRKVPPFARVRLGDAVWVVTRDVEFQTRAPSASVKCERRAFVGGWIVLFVELPQECNRDLIQRIGEWLQRPIGLPRARVWVEQPFPIRITSRGTHVYRRNVDMVVLRADQIVDLEILETKTKRRVLHVHDTTYAEWRDVSPGYWTVRANGSEFVRFEVCSENIVRPPALEILCGDMPFESLFELHEHIASIDPHRLQSINVSMHWSAPELGALLRVDDVKLDLMPDARSVQVVVTPGVVISASNMGIAAWRSSEMQTVLPQVFHNKIESLRERARWLLSIASPPTADSEVIRHIPKSLINDQVIGRLVLAAWCQKLAPQVRALAKEFRNIP